MVTQRTQLNRLASSHDQPSLPPSAKEGRGLTDSQVMPQVLSHLPPHFLSRHPDRWTFLALSLFLFNQWGDPLREAKLWGQGHTPSK